MIEADLSPFDLNVSDFKKINEQFYYIEKWNWDYQQAHDFQLKCVEYIRNNPNFKIFIFCSHPHVFTLGKGLQKNTDEELIDFNPALTPILPFPLHPIKRGGGLTFHYPGQWVCYPIMGLRGKELTVYGLMKLILETSKDAISEIAPNLKLNTEKDLFGLWLEDKKLASIGLAVSRLITYHGMALNIYRDSKIEQALQMVNPCGLSSNVYTTLEAELKLRQNLFMNFHENFLKSLKLKITL